MKIFINSLSALALPLALALAVGACSKVAPLTAEQKARFIETVSDVQGTGTTVERSARQAGGGLQPTSTGLDGLELARAILNAHPKVKAMPAPMRRIFGGYFGIQSDIDSEIHHTMSSELPEEWQAYRTKRKAEREERLKKVSTEMEASFREGDCSPPEGSIEEFVKRAGNPEALKNFSFKISGNTCPIFAEFKITDFDQNPNKLKIGMAFKMEIKDAALAEVSEVKQMEISFNMTASGDESGGSADGSLKGKVSTASEGDLKFEMSANSSGNSSGQSGEATFRVEFKDFVAELKVEGDAQNQKLSLNGEETTVAELSKMFELELPQISGQASNPGGFTPPPGFDVDPNE
jgi:hypothetical protein